MSTATDIKNKYCTFSKPSVSSSNRAQKKKRKKKQWVNSFWESRLEANWNNFPLLQGRPNYIVFELQDWEKEILWVNLEVCNCSETARKGNCESDSCKANGHSSVIIIALHYTFIICDTSPLPLAYLRWNKNNSKNNNVNKYWTAKRSHTVTPYVECKVIFVEFSWEKSGAQGIT